MTRPGNGASLENLNPCPARVRGIKIINSTMKPNKIIFLDIDGVLTHPSPDWRFCMDCINRLLSLVENCDAKIVICSSWKESTLEKTVCLLPKKLRQYIVDQTPDIPGANKGQEVSEYLHQHPSLIANLEDEYVILDDEPEEYTPMQQSLHLVVTDMYIGLSDKNVEKAKKILNTNQ